MTRSAPRACADTDFTPLSDHRGSAEYRRRGQPPDGTVRGSQDGAQRRACLARRRSCRATTSRSQPTTRRLPIMRGRLPAASTRRPRAGSGTPPARRSTSRTSPPGAAASSSARRVRTPTLDHGGWLRSKYLADAVLFSHDIPGDPLIGPIVHDEPVLALDTVLCRPPWRWWWVRATRPVAPAPRRSVWTTRCCRRSRPSTRRHEELLTDEHRIARGDLEAALAQADVIEGRTESETQDLLSRDPGDAGDPA